MKDNYRNRVTIWLATGAFLILVMVVVGGMTRLTHSGLSMVNWDPISGTIPPLNDAEWEIEFNNYKQYPEYKKINYTFTLEDFKGIFWWEYIHRLIGRVLGIVFIIPFALFLMKKVFDKEWIKYLVVLLLLGAFQGLLGWYMVKSGLVDRPSVSHFRLAAHLSAAFTLFGYILWLINKIRHTKRNDNNQNDSQIYRWSLIMTILIGLQIVYGAFVAGLKAGLFLNTWPKMDSHWISPAVGNALEKSFWNALFNDPTTIQFIHRSLPYFILIALIFVIRHSWKTYNTNSKLLITAYLIQVVLGILTLIMKVPVSFGVLHQLGAVFLLSMGLLFLFQTKKGRSIS